MDARRKVLGMAVARGSLLFLFDIFLDGRFSWLLVELAQFLLREMVEDVVVLGVTEDHLFHPEVFYGPQEQE